MKHTILIVTKHNQALAPIQAVMKSLLHYEPMIVSPDRVMPAIVHNDADLVILDMQTGDKLSRALIEPVKKKFPLVPLIALVPYADLAAIEDALAQGADDYMAQPIALERLRVSIRNALRLRKLLAAQGAAATNQILDHSLSGSLKAQGGQLRTMREIEELAITHALEHSDGCITQAARALGVGRSTLYRKIQEIQASNHSSRANQTTRPTMLASATEHS